MMHRLVRLDPPSLSAAVPVYPPVFLSLLLSSGLNKRWIQLNRRSRSLSGSHSGPFRALLRCSGAPLSFDLRRLPRHSSRFADGSRASPITISPRVPGIFEKTTDARTPSVFRERVRGFPRRVKPGLKFARRRAEKPKATGRRSGGKSGRKEERGTRAPLGAATLERVSKCINQD